MIFFPFVDNAKQFHLSESTKSPSPPTRTAFVLSEIKKRKERQEKEKKIRQVQDAL